PEPVPRMKNLQLYIPLVALTLATGACAQMKSPQIKKLAALEISENRRYLVDENGNPFFWLGDTGWLLFSKLTREEADKYLTDRAAKGFNVIQVMVLHSPGVANVYGDSALIGRNVANPLVTEGNAFEVPLQYDFWDNVDYIIDLAAQKGIYIALVPVWGSNVRNGLVKKDDAAKYAEWIANRYRNRSNIIWLNGGDVRGSDSLDIWNIIGSTIDKVDPGHLITFHPFGRTTSSIWFHNEKWLDFNMFQSGHRRYDQDNSGWGFGQDNWRYVDHDYTLDPVKPTIDGEPSYEGIPQGLHNPGEPYWDANDVRRYAYWSVFAGGFGFTYGANSVMQFYKQSDLKPAYGAREYWDAALSAPGSGQMQYLKKLMLSRPYLERIPDQSLISGDNGVKYDYLIGTRGNNYAFIYTYTVRNIPVKMGIIPGDKVKATWYKPTDGSTTVIGEFENKGTLEFDPPGEPADGNDWVLVLDAA
ncbi:MAG: glycoside hydrolase family 140 protein, partial [Bacteroidales bacterium]